jgi:hypothetical protein
LKGKEEKQPTKKIATVFGGSIFRFIFVKDSFEKEDVPQKEFLEDSSLLIIKNSLQIQFVKIIWLKCLVLHFCSKLNFLSKR